MIGDSISLAQSHPMFKWGLNRGLLIGFVFGLLIGSASSLFVVLLVM
jgi:hypothetical protein